MKFFKPIPNRIDGNGYDDPTWWQRYRGYVYWNKYYGYDEKYPDEDNYRVISGIIPFVHRDFTLIIVWSRLQFHLAISENLWTQWISEEHPPRDSFKFTFYGI